jgi:subtilisin family serine protease
MKKEIFFVFIISFLLFSIVNALDSREKKYYTGMDINEVDDIKDKGIKVIVKEDIRKGYFVARNNEIKKEIRNKIKYEFSSFEGFSATLDKKEIKRLIESGYEVYRDIPVKAFLQDSVEIVNASSTWNLKESGVNLTGEGETICIIDTGVNYTHTDLGGCNIEYLTFQGDISSNILQSAHDYSNNYDNTWTIQKEGYSMIGIHFVNISTEDSFDFVGIYDGNDNIVAIYSGQKNDFWTPSVIGDTIKVRLWSDDLVTDYGFYINEVINGTTNLTFNWSSCNKVIGGWDTYNYDPNPYDDQGHGTHVSGIVSANGDIKGIAPDADIVIVKALNEDGEGTLGNTVAALEWCINNSEKYNISAISMSLGAACYNGSGYWTGFCFENYCDNDNDETYGFSTIYSDLINSAVGKNISVVVATGNENNVSSISFPSCIENVTRVASSTKSDTVSSFSNRNSIVNLIATGGSSGGDGSCTALSSDPNRICSTSYRGNYVSKSGTSMATPMVSGAIAIINQYLRLTGESLTPREIEDVLNDTGKIIADSASGLNFSRIDIESAINYLDSSNPYIITELIYPENYKNGNIEFENFSCRSTTSSNFQLTNVTFYMWNSSNDVINISNYTISGRLNITNFSQNFNEEGNYTWNCLSFNNISNSSFAESNFTFTYDITNPNLNLISPDDEYSFTSSSTNILFEFNVSDNFGIDNCSLGINSDVESDSSIINNESETQSISKTLAPGTYSWNITCFDYATNKNISESRTLTINRPSSGGGGGGSSGGGGASSVISESDIEKGYTKRIKENERITFKIQNELHNLILGDINETYASLTLRSDEVNFTLNVGDLKMFNLDGDNYYDLSVKLNGIEKYYSNITIKKINDIIKKSNPDIIAFDNETATKNDTNINVNNTGEKSNLKRLFLILISIFFIVFIVIFILIIAFIISFSRKDKKHPNVHKIKYNYKIN